MYLTFYFIVSSKEVCQQKLPKWEEEGDTKYLGIRKFTVTPPSIYHMSL